MRVYFRIIIFITLLFLSHILFAETKKLTLNDAILLALRTNPNIESSRLNSCLQKFNLHVQEWAFAPQYTFQASDTYTQTNSVGEHTSATSLYNVQPTVTLQSHYGTQISLNAPYANTGSFNPGLSLQIMQPLLRGFGKPIVDAALNNAKDSVEIAKLTLKNTVETTITSVVNAYLDVISAKKSILIDQDALQRANISVIQTKLFIKAGHKAENELMTVESNVASAKLQLLNDQNNYQQARYGLLAAIGLNPNKDIELTELDISHLLTKFTLPSAQSIRKLVLANDVQYQIDNITLNGSMKRTLLAANDNQRWQLNFAMNASTGHGYTNNTSDTGQSNWVNGLFNGTNRSQSVSLTLNIPINDQIAKQAALSAKVGLKQAELNLKQERWSKETSAINNLNVVLNAKEGLVFSQTVANLQKQAYEMAYQKYLHGLIDSLELQSAQIQLIQSQQSLLAAQMNYIKSLVSLDLITGYTLQTWNISLQ